MDRLERMRLFIRVVEMESFTRAAEALKVPRSTVSTAVKTLEAEVGARLLNRTTRTVRLTDEGSLFYQKSQRLLLEYDQLQGLFTGGVSRPRGKLRVNVPGRLGRRILAPALPNFLARYPDIDVELGVTDRVVDLVREGVDCVIRVGELPDSNLIVRPVGELSMCNCASPDYLTRFGKPDSVRALASHQMVGYASSMTGRLESWEYCIDGRSQTLTLPVRVAVNTAEALIACALSGLGLIQVPLYDVRHHLDSGRLVSVLPESVPSPMPISLLYPHREHMTRRLEAFLGWVTDLLQRKVIGDYG